MNDNKPQQKRRKAQEKKQLNDEKIIITIQDYYKIVGQRTVGINRYAELKRGL
jgi:hypothetical protein